jgi:hypothetical protein
MNSIRLGGIFFSILTFWFAGGVAIVPSVCEAAPPKVAPPEPAIDKEQFANAKLEFEEAKVEDKHLIFEIGKTYKYKGSFQLADPDEDERYLTPERIKQTLGIMFVIDGEKSGYGPPPPERAAIDPIYVIITQTNKRPSKMHVDESNVLHFEGEAKVPRSAGEHQMRLYVISREPHARVFVLTRQVKVVEPKTVVEPKAPKGP